MTRTEVYIILAGAAVVAAFFLSRAAQSLSQGISSLPGAASQAGANLVNGGLDAASNIPGNMGTDFLEGLSYVSSTD